MEHEDVQTLLEDFSIRPRTTGGLSPFSGSSRGPRGNWRRQHRHPIRFHHGYQYPHRPWWRNYWQPQYVVQPLVVYPPCQCITHSEHPDTINNNPALADNSCEPNDIMDPCFCYSTCPDRFGNLDRQWYNCSAPDRGGLGAGSTVCRFRN